MKTRDLRASAALVAGCLAALVMTIGIVALAMAAQAIDPTYQAGPAEERTPSPQAAPRTAPARPFRHRPSRQQIQRPVPPQLVGDQTTVKQERRRVFDAR